MFLSKKRIIQKSNVSPEKLKSDDIKPMERVTFDAYNGIIRVQQTMHPHQWQSVSLKLLLIKTPTSMARVSRTVLGSPNCLRLSWLCTQELSMVTAGKCVRTQDSRAVYKLSLLHTLRQAQTHTQNDITNGQDSHASKGI